jgi:phospholipid/cholesterol/gamma-HCH transport system substrate-binding protein
VKLGRHATRLSDGAVGIVAAVLTVLLLVAVETGTIANLLKGSANRTVRAVFADTRQLKSGDPVRISGVNVGTVDSLSLDPGGRAATVTMKLDDSAGPLYADARASVRFRTLLGGAFFVRLDRGSSSTGSLGSATIPPSRTGSQVEVDDITSVIDGRAKRGLQTLPGQLSTALRDPRYPAQTLQRLAAGSPSLAAGLSAIRGMQPDTDLRTLIGSANTTVKALDSSYGQLQQLVSGTASVLQATSARSGELQATIQQAPPLLDQANRTMQSLQGTLRLANPLLVKLLPPAPVLAPTVRDLRGTVLPANTLLNRAVPLLRDLRPAVGSLASASQTALPLLGQLTPILDELDGKIVPYLNEVQPDSKHTFAQMIGPGLASLAAIGGYQDNIGRFVRFPATSGNAALYLPCQTYFNNPASPQAIACQSIGSAFGQLFGAHVKTGGGK